MNSEILKNLTNTTLDLHHAAEVDRVRANTESTVNTRIDAQTEHRLRHYASQAQPPVADVLHELDQEWDVERVLEVESSSMALVGLVLSLVIDKRFLLVPGFVSAMVLLHATQGWYPLLPLFRRLGLRTRNEIDRERYAMKALRGDFTNVITAEGTERALAAWRAVLA